MNDDLALFIGACSAAYHDGRRDSVEAALGTLKRIGVEKAIEQYIEVLKRNRQDKGGDNVAGRNSHAANTRLVLRKLLLKTLKVEFLDQLTDTVVRQHTQTASLSPKTRRNHLCSLSGLCSWARSMKYLSQNPAESVRAPATAKSEITFIPQDRLMRILDTVRDSSVELPVALALLAGLRRCEIVRLEPRCIDWETRHIHVSSRMSKTGRARKVPISDRLAEIIRRRGCLIGRRLCLNPLGNPWNPPKLTIATSRRLKKAGCGRITYNLMRHSTATHWLDQEKPHWLVAKWLGHSLDILEHYYGAHIAKPEHASGADIVRVAE